MTTFWWILGALLAMMWLGRALECMRGLRSIADLTAAQWDRLSALAPLVSVVVPARNEEAEIENCLRSLLAQDYLALEVIAVNDRSTDSTGAIMDCLAAEAPARLRVIHIRELPPQWLGKTHAMWTAAQQARGRWLLFTDGDIIFAPSTVRRALTYAMDVHADHVPLFPTAILRSSGERMMMGFFSVMSLVAMRPWKIADPDAREFFGVGAFNFIRREAYEGIGTFESLRMNLIDDLNLGRRVKQQGFKQRIVLGQGLITLHWAHGALGYLRNLEKNFFALLRFRLGLTFAAVLLTLVMNIGPWLGLAFAHGWARALYAAALIGMLLLYVQARAFVRIGPAYVLLHPVAAVYVAVTMLNSALHAVTNRGIVWRGTLYSLADLRRHLD